MKILLFFFSLLTAFQGRDSIPSDNVKLVQFAQTNSIACGEDLPYGSCSASTFAGSDAFICSASYSDRISDTWRQELYNDGSLEFEITWKFETGKTLSQRFIDAVKTGERVIWTVKMENSTVTHEGTWRFSSTAGQIASKFGRNKTGSSFSDDNGAWGSGNGEVDGATIGTRPAGIGGISLLSIQFYGHGNIIDGDDYCRFLFRNRSVIETSTIVNKMFMEEYRIPAPTTTIATVTDKGLGVADLTCSETGFSLTGNARSYPEYVPSDILVGLCVLGPGFFLKMTNYSVCGATKIVHGRNITYIGTIKNKPPTSVITRKKSINYIWECSFDTESNKTASAKIRPIVGQLTGSISKHNGPIDVQLNLLDLTGAVIQEGGTLALKVNSQVTATVTGKNLDHMGLNVYATNCHTTPSNNPKDPISYTLLENGCPRDPTFKIATYGRGQRMTFRAFAFSSNTSAAVYLHCKLIKCKVNAGCGKCHLNHRRRRSLRQYTGTKRKTGVMTMGSAKIQVY